MNNKDFNALLKRRIELTQKVLASKSKEYSSDFDKLHNFKLAGKISGQHEAEVAFGFLLKHFTSFMDMKNQIAAGKKFKRAYLDEKFGNIINYFILIEAIFVESGLEVEERLCTVCGMPLVQDEVNPIHTDCIKNLDKRLPYSGC